MFDVLGPGFTLGGGCLALRTCEIGTSDDFSYPEASQNDLHHAVRAEYLCFESPMTWFTIASNAVQHDLFSSTCHSSFGGL